MPFEVSLVVAFSIIGASFVALLAVVSSRRQAAHEEDLRQGASARGWQFEKAVESGYRVHRWRGTTDGVAWTAESLHSTKGSNQRTRRRHIARWRTTAAIGVTAPIICIGQSKGAEAPSMTIGQGDGWLAQLAHKAAGFALDKAIDTCFGDELGRSVEAGALKRVAGDDTPGFVVMAADVHDAARVLVQGLRAALVDAANDHASVLSQQVRPWILLSTGGVALARLEKFRGLDDIDGFIKAGVKLTRLPTFGRPSLS